MPTFIQFTDLHLGNTGSAEAFQQMIDEINRLEPRPDFVIHTGDICMESRGAPEIYEKLCRSFEIPLYDTLGNHDVLVGEADPKAEWRKLTGRSNYYSFDVGGAHFVVMDGHETRPEESGLKNVIGKIGQEENEWLESDLASVSVGTPIIGFIHIPIVSTYPQRRGVVRRDVPAWEIVNDEEMVDLLGRYQVKAVFSGHFHENEKIIRNGVAFVSTGAVCGSWWDWENWPHNPDGSPKGYRIVTVQADTGTVSSIYKGLGRSVDEQLFIFPMRQLIEDRYEIIANVFDGNERWHVEFRVAEGDWLAMEQFTAGIYEDASFPDGIKGERPDALPKICTHLWRGFAVGLESEEIEIRARDPEGHAWSGSRIKED